MVSCPRCRGEIQPTWDWCHLCGFDPDGLRPADAARTYAPPPFAPAAGPARAPGAPPPSTGSSAVYTPPSFGPQPAPGGPGAPHQAGYGYAPPPVPRPSGGATVAKVLGGLALAFFLLVGVCIAAVVLLGRNPSRPGLDAPPPAASTWQTWSAPDGTFTVDLPGTPTVQQMPSSDARISGGGLVQAQIGAQSYIAGWADAAPGLVMVDPQGSFDGAVQGMQQDGSVKVTDRQDTTFAGMPAMRFSGEAVNGPDRAAGMVVLTDTRIYTFMVVTGSTTQSSAELEKVLASFHLL